MNPINNGFSYPKGNLTMATTLELKFNMATLIARTITPPIALIIKWRSNKLPSISSDKNLNLHIQEFVEFYKTITNRWQTITYHCTVVDR